VAREILTSFVVPPGGFNLPRCWDSAFLWSRYPKFLTGCISPHTEKAV